MKQKITRNIILAGIMALAIGVLPAHSLYAETAKEIDIGVDVALEQFRTQVKGSQAYLDAAKGILVIPRLAQAGLVIGGEYGEGALRIGGKTVDYYSLAAASLGLQAGVQEKDIILIFMDEEALKQFRSGDGWQAGIDGTVVAVNQGAEGSVDTTIMNQPIIGFVIGQRGFMAGASFEGAKFTKLKR
jgi:lipid-binding SYLF domain-containing protein